MTARTGFLPIESDDIFEGIYRFSDGGTVRVHLDYLERAPRRRMRIVGSQAA